MFEFIYSKARIKHLCKVIKREYSTQKAVIPLFWSEHCVECAAPSCYATCDRYKKRADGDCVRIVDGITPVLTEDGIGAKCEFRTWAKIESQLKIKPVSGKTYARSYIAVTVLGYFFRKLASLSPFKRLQQIFDWGWFSYRQKLINLLIRKNKSVYALDLHGKVSGLESMTTLLVDIKSATKHLFRQAVEVSKDNREFDVFIPPFESKDELFFINIHPANAEQHISVTFNQLELIPRDITKGKKVKLVIWDLDNTLWSGTLIENKDVTPNSKLISLIKHLDECGIVNSIASKNDNEQASQKLKDLNIDEYFVFKKINWEPKSVNVLRTIKQMNINPDTVIFVDDNPYERNEVLIHCPAVTCIDPSEMTDLVKCQRFKMIVTEDSKKRRSTYKMIENLKTEEENWSGDMDDFLRSCNIKLSLLSTNEDNIPRCYELLQRTNQLNSSGRRLSMEEVRNIVDDDKCDCYVLQSSDKFGDYGIVGFLIVDKHNDDVVTDFVISCRVANKKIEPSLINWLAKNYGGSILFDYRKTLRNGPMFSIIKELNMEKVSSKEKLDVYKCTFNPHYPDIVKITDDRRM